MKFSGRLADFSLPDILRILIQSQKSGRLEIRFEGHTSSIYVSHGALHHAESVSIQGEKAVFAILNLDPTAEFEFVELKEMPEQTIHSDLDTLIQNGISNLENWKKLAKQFPRLTANTEILLMGEVNNIDLSKKEREVIEFLSKERKTHLHLLLEQVSMDLIDLANSLVNLENSGFIQVTEEKRAEIKRFFLVMSNTLLAEFNSISGMKLKQEMTERLEKLISENNWKIELQNGRIVDDKKYSSSLQEQTELYSECLNHLIRFVSPIYGNNFIQQVIEKVEQSLSGPVQHWITELKIEL